MDEIMVMLRAIVERLDVNTAQIEALSVKMDRMEGEIVGIKGEIAGIKGEIAGINQRLDRMEKQQENMAVDLRILAKDGHEQKRDILKLKDAVGLE